MDDDLDWVGGSSLDLQRNGWKENTKKKRQEIKHEKNTGLQLRL